MVPMHLGTTQASAAYLQYKGVIYFRRKKNMCNAVETLKRSRMRAQRSSVCLCVSYKHLFPRDISEGHRGLMFSLVSVMSQHTHRLWKEAVKTNSSLHRVTSDSDLAAPTEYPQIHFFPEKKGGILQLMLKTPRKSSVNTITGFHFLYIMQEPYFLYAGPRPSTYLRCTSVHLGSFSIHGWDDFLQHPCWKRLNTFRSARDSSPRTVVPHLHRSCCVWHPGCFESGNHRKKLIPREVIKFTHIQ